MYRRTPEGMARFRRQARGGDYIAASNLAGEHRLLKKPGWRSVGGVERFAFRRMETISSDGAMPCTMVWACAATWMRRGATTSGRCATKLDAE